MTTRRPRSSTRRTWRLQITGSGLLDAPQYAGRTVGLADLLRLPPAHDHRRHRVRRQRPQLLRLAAGHPGVGHPVGLGAIGWREWTGVPLSVLLEGAGVSPTPWTSCRAGLDSTVVANGVDNGHVRRPFPMREGVGRRARRALDERPAAAAGPRRAGPRRGAGLGRRREHQVGRLDRGVRRRRCTRRGTPRSTASSALTTRTRPPLTNQVVKSAFQLVRRDAAARAAHPAARALVVGDERHRAGRGQLRRR